MYRLISLHLWLILCDSYIYFASTFVHLFTWFKISLCLSLALSLYNINSTVWSHGLAVSPEPPLVWSVHSDQTSSTPRAADIQKGPNMNMHPQKRKKKTSPTVAFSVWGRLRWRADGPRASTRVREVRRSATSPFAQRDPVMGERPRARKNKRICSNSTVQTHQTQTDWSGYTQNTQKNKGGSLHRINSDFQEQKFWCCRRLKCGFLISSWDLPDPCC